MSIFNFESPKQFLQSYLESLPKRGHGELSKIARHLNASTTWISQVFAGEKVLALEQAQDLAEYLNLTPAETDFFLYLIQRERAGTTKLKQHWTTKIEMIRQQSLVLATRIPSDRTLTDSYCEREPGRLIS